MKIGQKIRLLRKKRGWSQQRLANEIDSSIGAVRCWEQGIRIPNSLYRKKICKSFGVAEQELFSSSVPVRKVVENTLNIGELIELSLKTEKGIIFVIEGTVKRKHNA